MSVTGVQGQILELLDAPKLRDTEWITRQDPYVCIEYGNTKFRTSTCKDVDRNPSFQEKFAFNLIDGLQEINVVVWNYHHLVVDQMIGSGKVLLHKVLSEGFDDSSWPLYSRHGRYAGDVRVIMHYKNANKPHKNQAPPATPCAPPAQPPPSPYPPSASCPPPPSAYPPAAAPAAVPTAYWPASYPPQPSVYPPTPNPGQYPGTYPLY